MALGLNEVAFLVVIKNRRVVRIEPYEGTAGKVTPLTLQEKQTFSQSLYGLRPAETIYETDTGGPNTCYMTIGGFKIEVPCG